MKLIIINGPTGIGKSTVSKLLYEQNPKSFLLNIDEVRRNISHYAEHREESLALSHAISRSMIRTVFENGKDVILEKCMIRAGVIDGYRAVAEEFSAEIHEFILWAPKEFVMERADTRGWHEGGLLTQEKCAQLWDKINVLKDQRPQAKILEVINLSPEQVCTEIRKYLI